MACSCAFADQKNTTAILAVNRQISQEAMPFFYRNLEVRLTERDLPAKAAVHLRQIVVFAWDTLDESPTGSVTSSLYDGQWHTLTETWPHLTRLIRIWSKCGFTTTRETKPRSSCLPRMRTRSWARLSCLA